MKTIEIGPWIYYLGDNNSIGIDKDKCGKWMYFFDNKEFVSKICSNAVKMNIVNEAKHNNAEEGVSCFYISADDIEAHKKVISYFIENNLIRKTKSGRLYNISFKLDNQTRNGEYGSGFTSDIKLANFINLDTGEWII